MKAHRLGADSQRAQGPRASALLAATLAAFAVTPVAAQTVTPGQSYASTQSGSTATLNPSDLSQNADDTTATGDLALRQTQDVALTPEEQDALDLEAMRRQNLPQKSVDYEDRLQPKGTRPERDGIRLGTVVLRPSLSERLLSETTKTGGSKEHALYSSTTLKGSLTSDWSRHELSVTGAGTWQKLLSGSGDADPSADVNANLRLDLAAGTTVTLSSGYSFTREDAEDQDAIANAKTQYGIHRFDGGITAAHAVGRLRGSVGLDGSRWLYSDAVLNNGTDLSLEDRQRTLGTLRGRLGYEISPALIPFIEVSGGRLVYDQKTDSTGYQRSAYIYAAKTGAEFDFGEKLRGELAVGYIHETFDDARLNDINGLTLDGTINWSPRDGTDIKYGLSTSLDPATTAGTGGAVVYSANAEIAQQLRDNLVATLTGTTTWNRYPDASSSNSTSYAADAELAYEFNRYLALTAGLGYEYTQRKTSADTEVLRASVGLTAKR